MQDCLLYTSFTFEWKGLKKLCVAVSFRSIIAEQKKEPEIDVYKRQIQEGNRLLTVEKGHKITGVLKGSLSEDVFQDRGTIAGSVHVDAVNNGGEGDGIQAYTAIKEILLAVEESKIALTPDGIQPVSYTHL